MLIIHNISYTAIWMMGIIILNKFSVSVASLATAANANEVLEYAKFGCW